MSFKLAQRTDEEYGTMWSHLSRDKNGTPLQDLVQQGRTLHSPRLPDLEELDSYGSIERTPRRKLVSKP